MSPMQNAKKIASYITLFFIVFTLSLVALRLSKERIESDVSYTVWDSYQDREQIFYVGSIQSVINNSESFKQKLSLYEPDLLVFGGDNTRNGSLDNEQGYLDAVTDIELIGADTLPAKSSDDDMPNSLKNSSYDIKIVGDIANIYLNTTAMAGSTEDFCRLDQEQLDFLNDTLDKNKSKHTVLYMHHALWGSESFVGQSVPTNAEHECTDKYWANEVLPIIVDRVDVVISSNAVPGTSYIDYKVNGTKYVLSSNPINDKNSGSENEVDLSTVTLVRITTNEDELFVNKIILPGQTLSDTDVIEDVKTYSLDVDPELLKNMYQNAPFYNSGLNWREKTEPPSVMEFVEQPLDATLEGQDVLINIRGNVGNHWEDYKKSWDINFINSEERQIKLILPPDRLYTNQMFMQYISEWFGVPTPKISLARLVINDIDYGIYMEYEDFDKAFVELNGYNSNAKPSKNIFIDHYKDYSVYQGLSNTTGDKQDKTYQQALSQIALTSENFNNYFDADNYARWLAVQIVSGDKHQGLADNFRYFIDKPTGRYILVAWDGYYVKFDAEDPYLNSYYNSLFMANTENQTKVRSYVAEFLESTDVHYEALTELNQLYGPIFMNDPGASTSKVEIKDDIDLIEENFQLNNEKLLEWLAQ